MRKKWKWIVALAALAGILAGCGVNSGSPSQQQDTATFIAHRKGYVPTHDIEFKNYDLRQRLADDPSTILWCTFFPPGVQGATNGSAAGQAITVPIAGKLTSSLKRPWPSTQTVDFSNIDSSSYTPELPGPDKMYGSSAEYRYGFDPTRTIYYDFTNLASICTTTPLVWQSTSTKIVVDTNATLASVSREASKAIREGNAAKALQLLKGADKAQK